MKKVLILASAALLFAGCSGSLPDNGEEGEWNISFTASQESVLTKAAIGSSSAGKTAVNWQASDRLSVFDAASVNCEFVTRDFDAGNPTSCRFEGTVSELATVYTAVYPYNPAALLEDGVIGGIVLPGEQVAVAGSFDPSAALMASRSVTGARIFAFKNAVGFVKVTPAFDCSRIELCAGNGESLAGRGSISFDADGIPQFTLGEGASHSIALTAPEGSTLAAGTSWYIAVPVTTLAAGWSLKFTKADGSSFTRTGGKPVQFKRNVILDLGEIEAETEDDTPYLTFSADSEQLFTMDFEYVFMGMIIEFVLEEGEFFEYSVGNGEWVRFTGTVSDIAFGGEKGDLRLRGKSSKGTSYPHPKYGMQLTVKIQIQFSEDAVPVRCTGDIRTLVDYSDYNGTATLDARFGSLFNNCTVLTTAPELPSTELATNCYVAMFSGCTSLVTAPELPAKQLADVCYQDMFDGCTALKMAPELPATELAPKCYGLMFSGCTSLEAAPELPAKQLAAGCYQNMFDCCTALKRAPDLPATELASQCYYRMFNGCASLEAAPELPATELADYCYGEMFLGCISLKSAHELPATELADYCYYGMFNGCTSLKSAPELPATQLADYCYYGMFNGCASLESAPVLKANTLVDRCYGSMFAKCTSLKEIKLYATDGFDSIDCLWRFLDESPGPGTIYLKNGDAADKFLDATYGLPDTWQIKYLSE